jgi:hypothetical protein
VQENGVQLGEVDRFGDSLVTDAAVDSSDAAVVALVVGYFMVG